MKCCRKSRAHPRPHGTVLVIENLQGLLQKRDQLRVYLNEQQSRPVLQRSPGKQLRVPELPSALRRLSTGRFPMAHPTCADLRVSELQHQLDALGLAVAAGRAEALLRLLIGAYRDVKCELGECLCPSLS